MSILYVLIPLGLVLVAIGAWAFFWAVGNGQFDDLESPGWSVLIDEETEHEGRRTGGVPEEKARE
jgi:cbb3-type cytochrome oxidase maturation protein